MVGLPLIKFVKSFHLLTGDRGRERSETKPSAGQSGLVGLTG